MRVKVFFNGSLRGGKKRWTKLQRLEDPSGAWVAVQTASGVEVFVPLSFLSPEAVVQHLPELTALVATRLQEILRVIGEFPNLEAAVANAERQTAADVVEEAKARLKEVLDDFPPMSIGSGVKDAVLDLFEAKMAEFIQQLSPEQPVEDE